MWISKIQLNPLCLNQLDRHQQHEGQSCHCTSYYYLVNYTMTTASASTATSSLIASIAHQISSAQVQEQVKNHLDTEFNDLEILLGISTSNGRPHAAGPSRKKRRTLDQEIIYWESQESAASAEVRLQAM
jgi:hypothetical protein